jgi:hypothetical protein
MLRDLHPLTEVEMDLVRIAQACRPWLESGQLAWIRTYLDALAELRARQAERGLVETAPDEPPPRPASPARAKVIPYPRARPA